LSTLRSSWRASAGGRAIGSCVRSVRSGFVEVAPVPVARGDQDKETPAVRGRLRALFGDAIDAAIARRATHYEAASRSRGAAYSTPANVFTRTDPAGRDQA
jgi:hypothetical protein